MKRVVEFMKKSNRKATFVLQLTAMVDMFTILIVFLLKSYSTSAVNITPRENLKLPYSSAHTQPVEALKLVVAKDGIYVDDKKVAKIKNGRIPKSAIDKKDGKFIKGLYKALDKQAERSKGIQKKNKEHEFKGRVIMQADSRLDYGVLQKVMYTSSMAGYADMKLATVSAQ